MEQLSLCRTLSPKEPWICSEPEGRKKKRRSAEMWNNHTADKEIKIYQHTVTSLKSGWEVLLIYTHLKLLGTFLAWQYSFSITFPRTHGRLDVPDAEQQSKTTQQRLESSKQQTNTCGAAAEIQIPRILYPANLAVKRLPRRASPGLRSSAARDSECRK